MENDRIKNVKLKKKNPIKQLFNVPNNIEIFATFKNKNIQK